MMFMEEGDRKMASVGPIADRRFSAETIEEQPCLASSRKLRIAFRHQNEGGAVLQTGHSTDAI